MNFNISEEIKNRICFYFYIYIFYPCVSSLIFPSMEKIYLHTFPAAKYRGLHKWLSEVDEGRGWRVRRGFMWNIWSFMISDLVKLVFSWYTSTHLHQLQAPKCYYIRMMQIESGKWLKKIIPEAWMTFLEL